MARGHCLRGEGDPSVPATGGGVRTWQLSAPQPRFHLFWGDPCGCAALSAPAALPCTAVIGQPLRLQRGCIWHMEGGLWDPGFLHGFNPKPSMDVQHILCTRMQKDHS